MRIGIVGGTGPAGAALAARLADLGYEGVRGSRSKYRSMEVVDALIERWPQRELAISPSDNIGAAKCDFVVIATPWDAAAITARSVADHTRGKVVVTMSNALARVDDEFVHVDLPYPTALPYAYLCVRPRYPGVHRKRTLPRTCMIVEPAIR